MNLPDKKYHIVLADPPWNESGGGVIRRGADAHYELMKTADIARLPISRMTAENAHLYLWVTNNYLPDGLEVMAAWGFKYKTMITWIKDRFGLGQYFRGITEHCLFGVKGFLPYKLDEVTGKRCQGKTGFFAPRSEHSSKPDRMLEMIERVSCREGTNQIELFARARGEAVGTIQTETFRDTEDFAGGSCVPNENLPRFGERQLLQYNWDVWGNQI